MRKTALIHLAILAALGACSGGSGKDGGSSDGQGDGGGGNTDDGGQDDGDDGGGDGGGDDGGGDGGGSDGTGDGDGDDGGAFVEDPDGGGLSACDPWEQDCPDGEKCMTWDSDASGSGDANKCTPIAENPKSIGDECDGSQIMLGVDDCEAGSYCSFLNDQDVGICIPMCTGSPDSPQCPPDHTCSIDNDGTLISCTPNCDPVLQDCAAEIAICMEASGQQGFVCASGWGEDGIAEGEECYYINSCREGLFCASAESVPPCPGTACCTPYCSMTDPVACTGQDYECVAYFETPVPGYEDTGVCVVPA